MYLKKWLFCRLPTNNTPLQKRINTAHLSHFYPQKRIHKAYYPVENFVDKIVLQYKVLKYHDEINLDDNPLSAYNQLPRREWVYTQELWRQWSAPNSNGKVSLVGLGDIKNFHILFILPIDIRKPGGILNVVTKCPRNREERKILSNWSFLTWNFLALKISQV